MLSFLFSSSLYAATVGLQNFATVAKFCRVVKLLGVAKFRRVGVPASKIKLKPAKIIQENLKKDAGKLKTS